MDQSKIFLSSKRAIDLPVTTCYEFQNDFHYSKKIPFYAVHILVPNVPPLVWHQVVFDKKQFVIFVSIIADKCIVSANVILFLKTSQAQHRCMYIVHACIISSFE